jgi:hypothetical protein
VCVFGHFEWQKMPLAANIFVRPGREIAGNRKSAHAVIRDFCNTRVVE